MNKKCTELLNKEARIGQKVEHLTFTKYQEDFVVKQSQINIVKKVKITILEDREL